MASSDSDPGAAEDAGDNPLAAQPPAPGRCDDSELAASTHYLSEYLDTGGTDHLADHGARHDEHPSHLDI